MKNAKRCRALVAFLFMLQIGNTIFQAIAPSGHVVLAVLCLVVVAGSWLVTNQTVKDMQSRERL